MVGREEEFEEDRETSSLVGVVGPTSGGHQTDRVRRNIVGFEQDEVGDWVALLECGHRQHVRHRPPWRERGWVVTAEGRQGRLGSPLECPDCDAAEEQGGDPACWADRVCPECGAVEEEGHHPGCEVSNAGDSS